LISTSSGAASDTPAPSWRPALPVDPTPVGDKAVAVLPFKNAGPPEDQYIADGLTEDLIDTLSMARGLRLRPHSAVVAFTGSVDSREVGRELGVQVVVQGSVRHAGQMIRIAARLISVADGFQLWAKRFDRPATDLLVVSDEAAAAIAEALTVEAAGAARPAPSDPRAIELYLRARAEFRRQWREPVERSVGLFRQALALAPDDPTIMAGYARACVRLWFFNGDEKLGDEAQRLAEQALARAPDGSDSLVAMAGVNFAQRRLALAARQVRAALARSPMLADAHHLLGGRPELAIDQLLAADQLDPGLRAGFDLARVLGLLGRDDEALSILTRPAADPESQASALSLGARLAVWRGDVEQASKLRSALEAAPTTEPIEYARLLVSLLERGSLGPGELAFMRQQLGVRRGRQMVLVHQLTCEVFARAGDRAEALQALDAAVDEGLHDLTWLERCAALESLRSDPRFDKALHVVSERARDVRAAIGID
jgi:TolB-like protein